MFSCLFLFLFLTMTRDTHLIQNLHEDLNGNENLHDNQAVYFDFLESCLFCFHFKGNYINQGNTSWEINYENLSLNI